MIRAFAGINADHLIDMNAVGCTKRSHCALPFPVPFFRQLYFQANDAGIGGRLTFAGFNKVNGVKPWVTWQWLLVEGGIAKGT